MIDPILCMSRNDHTRSQLHAGGWVVWLIQREAAELFDVGAGSIGLRLKNIREDGELVREATTEESSVVRLERFVHVGLHQ